MTLRNNSSKSTLVDLKKSPGNIADVIPTARLTVFLLKYIWCPDLREI